MTHHLKYIKVKEAYESFITDCSKIKSGSLVYEAIEEILKNPTSQTVFVTDDKGRLKGMIPIRDLIRASSARFGVRGSGFGDFITYLRDIMKDDADDLMRPPLSVTLDDKLIKAMKIMESYDLNSLPVIDSKGVLIGELNGVEILKFAIEGVKKGDLKAKELKAKRLTKNKRKAAKKSKGKARK